MPFLLSAEPFKVVTYNIENLFDASYQGSEYKQYIPGKHNWDEHMVDIKLNHAAEVICDLDADIIGLQEIENGNILKKLQGRLEEVGCSYKYSAITTKQNTAIQIALLSRYPIRAQKELVVNDTPNIRNILEVDVEVQGYPLKFFVNHWKSKSTGGWESKRIAYAKRLEKRIMSLPSDADYIIMGDLNSDYDAYLTLNERLDDANGRTGINDVLRTVCDEKLLQKHEIPKAQKGSHYNLWQELPFAQRWSHKFYGNKSTLDHILLPAGMFDKKGIDYVNRSFKVFKAPYLFTNQGYINRWQYDHGKHKGKGYSDHLPVHASFDTHPYVPDKNSQEHKAAVSKPIEFLYSVESLKDEVLLEDVVVLMKRGNHALIKQAPNGRGIYLYGCAKGLKEGRRYDIMVQNIAMYNGLKEITHAYKIKEKSETETTPYFNQNTKVQNEALKEIIGIYKGKNFYFDGQILPIHFKNKKDIPPQGSKLKLHYAHLGYYKQLQVVIYGKKDFSIVGK
ncbi:MAG: hypothetical protein QG564_879 [Campylobacterota bacterium]|nr:hypothetical protein [Campylobacterota bacterium]